MTDKAKMLMEQTAFEQKAPDRATATGSTALIFALAERDATITHLRAQLATVVGAAVKPYGVNRECLLCGQNDIQFTEDGENDKETADPCGLIHEDDCPLKDIPTSAQSLLSEVEGLRAQVATLTEDVKRAQLVQDAWSIEVIEGLKKRAEKAESELARQKQNDSDRSDDEALWS